MNTSAKVVMGIDVCQARLDTCRSDTGEALMFANDDKGIRRLLRQLKSHPIDLVACEATGGLEREATAHLVAAGVLITHYVREGEVRTGSFE